MKKLLLTLTLLVVATIGVSQGQMAYFILQSAPLDGNETDDDSLFVEQSSIVRIDELTSGGSQVTYINRNSEKSALVKEQVGDSAWTFASFTTVITTNDTLDSITVGGVNISGTVNATASTGATILAIRDSIVATTSSPNYTATADTTTGELTITPTADSTATPNGRTVIINYQGTASPSSGTLQGGFYRRNASTIYGAANKLFTVTENGNSNDLLINALRVVIMDGDNPTTIWYDRARNQNIVVDDNRASILTTMNAL